MTKRHASASTRQFPLMGWNKVGAIISAYTGGGIPFYDHQAFLAPGRGALLRLEPA